MQRKALQYFFQSTPNQQSPEEPTAFGAQFISRISTVVEYHIWSHPNEVVNIRINIICNRLLRVCHSSPHSTRVEPIIISITVQVFRTKSPSSNPPGERLADHVVWDPACPDMHIMNLSEILSWNWYGHWPSVGVLNISTTSVAVYVSYTKASFKAFKASVGWF